MRGLRTVPHLWSICEDMLAVAPERDHAAIRQPDGDQHLGDCGEIPDDPAGRPVPFGAGHRRRTCPRSRHSGRKRSATAPGGINHMAFYLNFEHRQADGTYRDLYPALKRGYREGRIPETVKLEPALPQQGALRNADAAGLFRHRKLGAFRRIHALVHQARPARPDRDVSAFRWTNIPCAASSRSPAGRKQAEELKTANEIDVLEEP